jgi:hypoxia up-regulated 1
MNMMVLR